MTTLTAQQIACVYAWLAQLFSRELDDEQLTQIASAQMAEWFSLLKSEPPLTAAVNELENRIATLTVRDDARLELAADFCGLFLMTDKQAARTFADPVEVTAAIILWCISIFIDAFMQSFQRGIAFHWHITQTEIGHAEVIAAD